MKHSILLINPWIHDFAAYDFWIKPLGLLYVARFLEQQGYACTLIDCLHTPHALHHDEDNTGKFPSTIIEKPAAVAHTPRHFKRYGMHPDDFRTQLMHTAKPLVIFITCHMTYWYSGLHESLTIIKDAFPDVPIILGGMYATLCTEHAQKTMPVDHILTIEPEEKALSIIDSLAGITRDCPPRFDIRAIDRPAYHLYDDLQSVAMLTSVGCPMHCDYCASRVLQPKFMRRSVSSVLEEVAYYEEQGIADIAFYDDALLVDPEQYIMPICVAIIQEGWDLRFHTPNGLHIRFMNDNLAMLLFKAGFKTLRLSFESTNEKRQKDSSHKVSNDDFVRAIASLKKAGFTENQIGVYLLIGLPDQTFEEIEESLQFIHAHNVMIKTAQYSPIPGTPYFEQAAQMIPAIKDEPLLHNRACFPLAQSEEEYTTYQRIKDLVHSLNTLNS